LEYSIKRKEVHLMRVDRIKLITELAKRDMTQTRLAELSGVSRATINYIKGGKRCTDEVGQKIAQALGVSVTKILED
jgi:plasmid maintenance system antidote protein VapI